MTIRIATARRIVLIGIGTAMAWLTALTATVTEMAFPIAWIVVRLTVIAIDR